MQLMRKGVVGGILEGIAITVHGSYKMERIDWVKISSELAQDRLYW